MENNLTGAILNICNILNNHTVQYLIVGGTAVALHGYFRKSMDSAGQYTDKPDLDFWYNPTYSNYFKLLEALGDLGMDVTVFKEESSPDPKSSFFKYELEKFTIDFLPTLKAKINFRAAFNRRENVTFSNINIPFICYEDLIFDKLANARPKDITDIKQLKTRIKEK
ncbi:hypothetical protein A8C56_18365 [Niabella ginsenosidivorans]|uniref:Nucleotidyltransferase n=1 Tax=Niabella ginsenosidivorans TaxID=1176587 RepID=A0A1A9I4S5_9BACT|nr:DUF6036 family nucleotidyltransferase [Niabella ginsenosidivorans]ANH82678.1 hypothetical protein A8C56_18365 [Niabella ginsenosidivorans]